MTVAAPRPGPVRPGEMRSPDRQIEFAAGRPRRVIAVRNGSRHPVRISSHYPFALVNLRLEFNRAAAAGFRLDVPAGQTVRWAPGETRNVTLVAAMLATGPADPAG